MEVAENWKDYEILDMSDGEKLERWGNVILIRPDPQIIWNGKPINVDAEYIRSNPNVPAICFIDEI